VKTTEERAVHVDGRGRSAGLWRRVTTSSIDVERHVIELRMPVRRKKSCQEKVLVYGRDIRIRYQVIITPFLNHRGRAWMSGSRVCWGVVETPRIRKMPRAHHHFFSRHTGWKQRKLTRRNIILSKIYVIQISRDGEANNHLRMGGGCTKVRRVNSDDVDLGADDEREQIICVW
jgi:hypothetical protein